MNIIFIAPPAAGKGTYCSILKEKYGFTHISAGDELRSEVKSNTLLGQEIKSIMERGEMIDDNIMKKVIEIKLTKIDLNKPFILDGYPRKLNQVEDYENILSKLKLEVDKVIFINISKDTGLKRILGRMNCPVCKKIYNLSNKDLIPKTEGKCDDCKNELSIRKDDNKESYETRYDIYMNETLPVIEYYKNKRKLYEIDGYGSIEEVFNRIIKVLGVEND